jgi:hypothetical protein
MTQSLPDRKSRSNTVAVAFVVTRLRLREEIRKRRISEEDFADWCGISYTWLRKILGGDPFGEDAKNKIRAGLERCTVCEEHTLTAPPDEELFSVAKRPKKTAAQG